MVTRILQEYDAAGNVTAHGNMLTKYPPIEMNRQRSDIRRSEERRVAGAAAVAVPETWHVNPSQGKFNPSTKAGQVIYEKKTKGLPADEHFTATKKYSQGIRRLLQAKYSSFGAVVTRVPQEYDGAGNVTSHGNVLTNEDAPRSEERRASSL